MKWIGDFARDLRFAARSLRRQPGFSVIAVTILTCAVPARRAARVDPTVVLRGE
jgi:hypothetical protein